MLSLVTNSTPTSYINHAPRIQGNAIYVLKQLNLPSVAMPVMVEFSAGPKIQVSIHLATLENFLLTERTRCNTPSRLAPTYKLAGSPYQLHGISTSGGSYDTSEPVAPGMGIFLQRNS
jgi:hypothetical protein